MQKKTLGTETQKFAQYLEKHSFWRENEDLIKISKLIYPANNYNLCSIFTFIYESVRIVNINNQLKTD